MGYTTDFFGEVRIEPPLNEAEVSYLQDFATTRRMDRTNGPFFVKGEGFMGQGGGPDKIINHNAPHPSQPGLWCQWVATDDGTAITWDGNEKFYDSVAWMEYIIREFLAPSGAATRGIKESADERFKEFTFDHTLNGVIDASGEEPSDLWRLVVTNNEVTTQSATISYYQ